MRRHIRSRRRDKRIRKMLQHIEEPPQPRGAQLVPLQQMTEFLWCDQPRNNEEADQAEEVENQGIHTTKTTYFDASDNFSDISI